MRGDAMSKRPDQVAASVLDAELAELIAEQEQDMLYGDTIRYSRTVSLDAPLNDDADAGSLADVVGEADAALADMLGENDTWVALVSQKAITDEDVRFWKYLRRRHGWTNTKIAAHVGVSDATVGNYLRAPVRRLSAQGTALSAMLPAARGTYEAGARLIDVAAQVYERTGYASPESCYQALRRLFLDRKVAIRPRSWKHGMRSRTASRETYIAYWKEQNRKASERRRAELTKCAAITREGRRCSRWARRGIAHCNVHSGLRGGMMTWPRERIAAAISAWTVENGRTPQPRDWLRTGPGHPSFKTVYNHFASWPEALAYALAVDEEVAA
jgi:hypothetical protein